MTARVDLDELEITFGDFDAIRSTITELRDLRARMERAPVCELTQVGWDDEDGKAFVMLCAPRDDGRAAATLLFKRVRLVVCNE